jgi:putative membrane protein
MREIIRGRCGSALAHATGMKISRLAFVAALALPVIASADDKKATTISDADTAVLAHAHAVNQAEIMMGKLAQKDGKNADVKAYGQELVKDHTAADKDLTDYAKAQGLKKIPDDKVSPEDKKANDKMMEQLKISKDVKVDKTSWDVRFLDAMVDAHTKEITKLDAAVRMPISPAVKAMLDGVRPVMQKHADDAAALDTKLKGGKA